MIEYGSVETALLLHMSARFLRRPFCRCRHVLDLEVFPHNHCVVFAALERKLLKEVLADIGGVLVEFCDAFFLFAPILPEFRHSGEAFLFKTEFLQILLQGVARCLKSAVRQRAKPFDAHIQADSVSLVFRRNAFKLRLDGHAPTVSPTAHCDGLGLSFNEPTPPVLHPTDTREFPEESKCIGCLPIRRQVVADAKLGGSGTVKLKDGQSGGLVGFIGLSPAIGEVLAHGALWRSGFGYHNNRGAFQGAFKAIGCLPKFSKTVVKKASHCVRMFENNAKYHNVYPR